MTVVEDFLGALEVYAESEPGGIPRPCGRIRGAAVGVVDHHSTPIRFVDNVCEIDTFDVTLIPAERSVIGGEK